MKPEPRAGSTWGSFWGCFLLTFTVKDNKNHFVNMNAHVLTKQLRKLEETCTTGYEEDIDMPHERALTMLTHDHCFHTVARRILVSP